MEILRPQWLDGPCGIPVHCRPSGLQAYKAFDSAGSFLVLSWDLKPYAKESYVVLQDLDQDVIINSRDGFLAWVSRNGFWSALVKLQQSIGGLQVSIVRLYVPVLSFGDINDCRFSSALCSADGTSIMLSTGIITA